MPDRLASITSNPLIVPAIVPGGASATRDAQPQTTTPGSGKKACLRRRFFVPPFLMLVSLPALAQPPAPTDLTVTSTSGTAIGLSWTAPADDGGGAIEAYNVYRCPAPCTLTRNDWLAWVDTGTTHSDSTVTAGASYRYAVAAYRGSEGNWSNEVTATAAAPSAPDAPTDFVARANSSEVALSWSPPAGTLTGYTLYRGADCDSLTSLQTTIAADAASAEDTTVTTGNSYCYAIAASNSTGEGSASENRTVTAVTVGSPTGLAVASSSATAIALNWTAPADDQGGPIEAYNVYRCDEGASPCDPNTWIAWVDDGVTFTDTADDSTDHERGGTSPLASGQTYRYTVAAYRVGEGPASNQVTATADDSTPPAVPDAPTEFRARASAHTAALNWTAPAGTVTGYKLYRGSGSSCANLSVQLSDLDSTYVEDASLTEGETYCYQVSASNELGEGGRSQSAVVTAVTPAAPRNLRIDWRDGAKIKLDWTAPAVDGGGPLDGYNLFRCEETGGAACDPQYLEWLPMPHASDYVDATASPGRHYRYALSAVRANGSSEWSNEVSTGIPDSRPPAGTPPPPRNSAPRFPAGARIGDLVFVAGEAIGPIVMPRAEGGDIDASLNGGELSDYSFDPADLPAGLRFDRFARRLDGTPLEGVPVTAYTLWVHDDDGDYSAGDADQLSFTITVKAGVGQPVDPVLPVWFLPSAADPRWEGVVRVINHSTEGGAVRLLAIDDRGGRYGPATLTGGAGKTVNFSSNDLELGNSDKGLPEGIGSGDGDWRLELETELDIEVLAYVRTADGMLTAMHDVAPSTRGIYRVSIFNPGSNRNQASHLRLINPGATAAAVTIRGIDDVGASPGSDVQLSLAPDTAVTLKADELEAGSGLEGTLGDGQGKWRLLVTSDQPIVVMNLLATETGHLTNLSTESPPAASR